MLKWHETRSEKGQVRGEKEGPKSKHARATKLLECGDDACECGGGMILSLEDGVSVVWVVFGRR